MRHCYLGLLLIVTGVFSTLCHAQANVFTAQRAITFEAGAGFTLASPDYSTGLDRGITAFAAIDLKHNLGIEFEYHNADIISPHDVGEVSYLGGIRYRIPVRRFQPYVKVLAGVGQVKFDQGYYQVSQSLTNSLFSFGAGLEYKVSTRIIVRAADFEVQKWPSFYPHTLTPYLFTTGAAYRF